MIPFFRKIRKKLTDDNQFFKYSRYAIGEIVLVVIGILIALQINNWNERKKETKKFKLVLEQVFNEMDIEHAMLVNNSLVIQGQIDLIDSILISPLNIPDSILPFALFYVDLSLDFYTRTSQSRNLISMLEYKTDNIEQLKISKQIQTFVNNNSWDFDNKENILEPILNEAGIPTPGLTFAYSWFENFKYIDKSFFKRSEIDTVRALLSSTQIQVALRSLRASRVKQIATVMNNSKEESTSLMKIIKASYPDVRLLYKDIGIIGSALETGWNQSLPMSNKGANQSLWTIDVKLNDGYLKFRSSNSWTQNWGGNGFPEGDAIYYWENISVKKGYYRVTLDLEKRSYSFMTIEE